MNTLSKNFVPPEGSESAGIYIVGEAPGQDEDLELRPFVGTTGKLLREAVSSLDINIDKEVRIFNVVPYRPMYEEDGRIGNRTPTNEEIQQYSSHLKEDILKVKPKVILCFGRTAIKALCPEFEDNQSVISAIKRSDLKFEGIQIQASYHPSYIERGGGKSCPAYYKEFIPAIKNAISIYDPKRFNEKLDIEMFQISQVDEFLSKFEDATFIGFDYEGSTLEAFSEDYELGGIGLARENYAAYLFIKDFFNIDYNLSEEVRNKIIKFLVRKQKDGLIVFNLKYECGVTINVFGEELLNVIDMMQYCRVLNMSGGLKEICRRELAERSWRGELDEWLEASKILLKNMKRTRRKGTEYPKQEELLIREDKMSIDDQGNEIYSEGGVRGVLIYLKEKGEKRNVREENIYNSLVKLITIAKKYSNDTDLILNNLKKIIISHIDSGQLDDQTVYTEAPYQIVGPYCCRDSWNTKRLYHKIMTTLIERDLVKTADYYNEQGYLAYELEKNGIGWNDAYAEEQYHMYIKIAVDCLKKLLLLPQVIKALEISQNSVLDIQSATDLDYLKSTYFNPQASDVRAREKAESFLKSKRLIFALLLEDIRVSYESERVEGQTKEKYPLLFSILNKISSTEKPKRLEVFDTLRSKLDELYKQGQFNLDEVEIIVKYSNWSLQSTDKTAFGEFYKAIEKQMGVDVDNESTWTPEMSCLFYYKLFKKVMKATSTYVLGGPGRQSVKVIRKSDIEEGKLPKRIRMYNLDKPPELQTNKGEILIFNPSYLPNSAVTKRWSSGAHTVPAMSEIRDTQISLFDDGVLIHFDYSQMEVRVIAVLSKDPSLLQAYREGRDIHRFVASKVWGKPEEEVSDSERRFAKQASFSILYGSSVQAFADQFMAGSINRAQELFDRFFTMFPAVKEWIDRMHTQAIETGEVTGLWGDTIIIDFDPSYQGSINQAKRWAQNYPIQQAASNISAVSLSRVVRKLQSSGYRSRIYGFTHDAGEIDTPPKETLLICQDLPLIAEQMVYDEWGIPAVIDVEIGTSANTYVGLKRLNNAPLVSRDGNIITLNSKFEGTQNAIDLLSKRLSKYCDNVHFDVKDEEKEFTSFSAMFTEDRAYSALIGKEIIKKKGILTINQTL